MKESEREEFVKQWKTHINALYILALTPSPELSKEIASHIKALNELTELVADDKIKAEVKR